jgi:hypothetical protein
MSRQVMRVPLDFDWPLGKRWHGYVMPQHLEPQHCRACEGSGYNPPTKQIADDFYDFAGTGRRWCDAITQDEVDALVAANRLWDFTRRFVPGKGWQDDPTRPHPTAAEVNAAQRQYRIHDAINRWALIEARAKRLGVWGYCEVCDGEGRLWANAQHRADYEAWERTEPPVGEGWQMWEITSEGSPMSPVFDTPGALARWLADSGASAFGKQTATYDQWLAMIRAGSSISAVSHGQRLMSGVAFVASMTSGEEPAT